MSRRPAAADRPGRHRHGQALRGVVIAAAVLVGAVCTAPASAEPDCDVPRPPPVCERPDPPEPPQPPAPSSPTGSLQSASRLPAGVQVAGRASDPDAAGPVAVRISVGGKVTGTLYTVDGQYAGTVPVSTTEGPQQVCAVAVNRGAGADVELGCVRLGIAVRVFGSFDQLSADGGGLRVRGWAIDPDSTGPVKVQVTVDGRVVRTADASLDRPDVRAAHPLYGARHGYDVVLPPRRHTTVCVTGIDTGAGGSAVLGCRRADGVFSVLAHNLWGLGTTVPNDNGDGTTEVPWRTRYDRLAAWMQSDGTLPDVIALQEVHLRKAVALPVPRLDPPDYEVLFHIIERIRARTGAEYRIAYAATGPPTRLGLNLLEAGNAVLYNPAQVRNITARSISATVPDDDESTLGVHARRSLPCRNPSPSHATWCDLLDGAGVYWASTHRPTKGKYAGRYDFGPQAVFFEPVTQPGRSQLVANVHAHPYDDPETFTSILRLTQRLTGMLAPRAYPPIIAGDFNNSPADMLKETTGGGFRAYARVAGAEGDEMHVLVGRPDAFPSRPWASFSAAVPAGAKSPRTGFCGRVATVLSDHCAVFAQLVPRAGS